MEGSHLLRGSHQRRGTPACVLPYQRGRTTRRNTRTRGLPRVGLRLRDRLAFVVVFCFSERRTPRGERRKRGRETGKRVDDVFLALEFFLPSRQHLPFSLSIFPYLSSLLSPFLSPLMPWSLSLSLSLALRSTHPAAVSLFHSEKASLRKQKGRQIALARISGRSRDYNRRDNAYYAPRRRSSPPGNESWPRSGQRHTPDSLLKD